eukprot:364258-Chlamydomonas_euryale.AAC.3
MGCIWLATEAHLVGHSGSTATLAADAGACIAARLPVPRQRSPAAGHCWAPLSTARGGPPTGAATSCHRWATPSALIPC